MQTYQSPWGSDIHRTAEKMVRLASLSGDSVQCEFNLVTLIVMPGETVDEIVNRYHTVAELWGRGCGIIKGEGEPEGKL